MSEFAKTLRMLRERINCSQTELAKRLGVASSTVSMYENGNREPTIESLKQIAGFFGVDMNFLVGYNADPTKTIWELEQYPECFELYSKLSESRKTEALHYLQFLSTIK